MRSVPGRGDPGRPPRAARRGGRAGRPLRPRRARRRADADLFDARARRLAPSDAAAAVLADLRGMRIAGDEALGRALIAAGGTAVRHAHLCRTTSPRPARELGGAAGLPADRRRPPRRRPHGRLRRRLSARPPRPPGRARASARWRSSTTTCTGGEFGPLLRGSGLAVAPDGAVAGAILLGTLPGDPPRNGPWVIERVPPPGAPRRRARAARAGAGARRRSALGLIVTEGNTGAPALYERLGFRLVSTALVVQI